MNSNGERLDILQMVSEIDLPASRQSEDMKRIKLGSYAFALREVLTEKPRTLAAFNKLHDRERWLKGLIPEEIVLTVARRVVRDWLEHGKT